MSNKTDKLNYACGMNISNCKKVCRFIFQDFFHSAKVNTATRQFDVLVYKSVIRKENVEGVEVDKEVTLVDVFGSEWIEYFREYWGESPGFTLAYFKGILTEQLEN